ncbi:polysaccharide biosynthesis/export family protein [Flavobacteriaceae bacterium]|nr:polysaccharide biosynthesis/export family protein [Flavobacteriaceae bacterium]
MRYIKYLSYILISIFAVGCATKKDIVYNLESGVRSIEQEFRNISIDYGDVLDINISSLNPESVAMFKRNAGNVQANVQPEILKLQGYLVDQAGFIEFPILGKVKAVGLSTSDLANEIKEGVSIYVKNPTVNVRLANYKITLLGEVARPGTYTVLEERIDILQAIGLAGDLTINADRRNVKLLRRTDNKVEDISLNLIEGDLLSSPYYYLKQNDVLYFAPNTAKIKSSGLIGNVGTVATVLSLLLSFVVILGR